MSHKTPFPLHPELQAKLEHFRSVRNFQPEAWINLKIQKFVEYLSKSGLKGAVVSVSGGVDSAVIFGLLKRTLDLPDSPLKKIYGLAQPIHSSDWALNRAKEAAQALKADLIVVDQTKLHGELSELVDKAVGVKGAPFASGQLRSYLRAPSAYYVAQLLSQQGFPAIVMGTGNYDEDGFLGYFCKAGDGVVDVQLIADLHKSEVFKVGAVLGIPQSILTAPPSADLWDGQTDEEELGFSYDFIELYTGAYLPLDQAAKRLFLESLSPDARAKFEGAAKMCEGVHNRNKHKFGGPLNINVMDNGSLHSDSSL